MAAKKVTKNGKKSQYFLNPWELVVLFMLPVLGFLLGVKYQQYVDSINAVIGADYNTMQTPLQAVGPTVSPSITQSPVMRSY